MASMTPADAVVNESFALRLVEAVYGDPDPECTLDHGIRFDPDPADREWWDAYAFDLAAREEFERFEANLADLPDPDDNPWQTWADSEIQEAHGSRRPSDDSGRIPPSL